jgi:hypothetical protein
LRFVCGSSDGHCTSIVRVKVTRERKIRKGPRKGTVETRIVPVFQLLVVNEIRRGVVWHGMAWRGAAWRGKALRMGQQGAAGGQRGGSVRGVLRVWRYVVSPGRVARRH